MPTDPKKLPPELVSIEPQPCKVCGKRVWFNKIAKLIYHDEPQCQGFIDTMKAMGGIELNSTGKDFRTLSVVRKYRNN